MNASWTQTGSLNVEVSSDGTNWKTVNNGSVTLISNIGIDLKWRATEDNSSTATLSNLIIGVNV